LWLRPPSKDGWNGGTDFYSVFENYIGDGLEMAIIPTPKVVEYSKRLFPVTKVSVIFPDNYNYPGFEKMLESWTLPGKGVFSAGTWQEAQDTADLVIGGGR